MRGLLGIGGDRGNFLTHKAHLIGECWPTLAGEGGKVRRCQNRPHPWYLRGPVGIDGDHAAAGFHAAHDGTVEHAGELDVKSIARPTSHLVQTRPFRDSFANGLQGLGGPPGFQPRIPYV